MFKIVILALVSIGLVNGEDVVPEKCDSTNMAVITKLSVDKCVGNPPLCTFKVDEDITFTFEVNVANHDPPKVTALPYVITTNFFGFEIKVAEGNACNPQMSVAGVDCALFDAETTPTITFPIVAKFVTDFPQLSDLKFTARVWPNKVTSNANASACGSIKATVAAA